MKKASMMLAAGLAAWWISAIAVAAGMAMSAPAVFPYGHPGPGSAPAKVIHIRALDTLRFVPARITVYRGETVKFVVTNAGKLTHEFVIGDAALQAAHQKEMQSMPGMIMRDVNGFTLLPGHTQDLVWTFTRDGLTEYACHEPGHFSAGMMGKIIIKSPTQHR
ncbi:MAG: cupredoxin domain-containing protein [Gammaproteobacteria bacterium]